AQWTPDLAEAGEYEVYVWNPAFYNNTNQARYTVTSAAGSAEIEINQAYGGQQWIQLGIYNFEEGTAGNVRLAVTEAMAHRADTVMFIPVP
ncbi:hypothetical protein K0U00_38720, partial [Paenibacillus sepulcri]|nr:hypothetical protein [Paenibacillus sepulcri]